MTKLTQRYPDGEPYYKKGCPVPTMLETHHGGVSQELWDASLIRIDSERTNLHHMWKSLRTKIDDRAKGPFGWFLFLSYLLLYAVSVGNNDKVSICFGLWILAAFFCSHGARQNEEVAINEATVKLPQILSMWKDFVQQEQLHYQDLGIFVSTPNYYISPTPSKDDRLRDRDMGQVELILGTVTFSTEMIDKNQILEGGEGGSEYIVGHLERLCAMRKSGNLTAAEFSEAKALVLQNCPSMNIQQASLCSVDAIGIQVEDDDEQAGLIKVL